MYKLPIVFSLVVSVFIATISANPLGFLLVEKPADATSLALSGGGSATAGDGFSLLNPAQVFFNQASSVSVTTGASGGDLRQGSVVWHVYQPTWFISLALPTYVITDLTATDIRGQASGINFNTQFTSLSVAGGFIKPRYAVGISLTGIEDRIGSQAAYAMSASIGLSAEVIEKHLYIALAAFHQGTTRGFLPQTNEWGKGDELPRSARLGIRSDFSLGSFEASGIADVVYRHDNRRIMQRRITVPLGIEVHFNSYISSRLAVALFHDTRRFSFGGTVRHNQFYSDFGVAISRFQSSTEPTWLVSLGYSLPSPRSH